MTTWRVSQRNIKAVFKVSLLNAFLINKMSETELIYVPSIFKNIA